MRTRALSVLLAAALWSSQTRGDVVLIGKAAVSGAAHDASRLATSEGTAVSSDQLGSFGSAIAYTGEGSRFIAIDDRGPNNGGVAWRCRFQLFDLAMSPGSQPPVNAVLVGTTLLCTGDGAPFTGNTGAYDARDQAKGLRLDPEGVRVGPRGTLFISDEYGPWIDEFSMDGRQLHRFPHALVDRFTEATAQRRKEGLSDSRNFRRVMGEVHAWLEMENVNLRALRYCWGWEPTGQTTGRPRERKWAGSSPRASAAHLGAQSRAVGVQPPALDTAFLTWTDGDGNTSVDVVGLQCVPTRVGGRRYWFLCPGCGRRRAHLYRVRNGSRCRVCAKVRYH